MTSDALRGVQSAVEVFRVLSVSPELDQTLNAVLDGLKSLIVYDAAGIYAIEPESGRLRAQVVRGSPGCARRSSYSPRCGLMMTQMA
jgi:hypothetical protein